MEWLDSIRQRLGEFVGALTPSARITAVAAGGLLLLGLAATSWWPVGTRYEFLLDGRVFSPQEAEAILTAFALEGLNDWKVDEGRICLPQAQRSEYLAALSKHEAMPESFGSAWERLFAGSNWLEPGKMRRLREQHAVQKELSLVVSRMAGVEMATVRYDEVETGAFSSETLKTAMVAAKATAERTLTEQQVASIRDLVAGSIAGLEPSQVTVTDLGAGLTYRGDRLPVRSNSHTDLVEQQRKLEESWCQRIERNLATYPGVVVAVKVDLEHAPNPPHGSRAIAAGDDDFTNLHAPHLASSHDRLQRPSSTPTPATLETHVRDADASPTVDLAPKSLSAQQTVGRVPIPAQPRVRAVTASIALPRSYFLKVWRRRQHGEQQTAAPTPAEFETLEANIHATVEKRVLALLPSHDKRDHADSPVVVTTFDDLVDSAPVDPLALHLEDLQSWWQQHWLAATVAGSALVLLLLMIAVVRRGRRARRTVPPAPTEPAMPGLEGDDSTEISQDSMQRELTVLVNRDPDAAARVLRDWIGDAA